MHISCLIISTSFPKNEHTEYLTYLVVAGLGSGGGGGRKYRPLAYCLKKPNKSLRGSSLGSS